MTRKFWGVAAILAAIFALSQACGGGGGGSGNNDVATLVWDIISWLPKGNGFDTEPFVLDFMNKAIASKGPAACPSDLNCDFNSPCRWRNVDGDGWDWYMAKGEPDKSALEAFTGSSDKPTPPHVLTAGNQDPAKESWFVSDAINKQPGSGKLQFRYWVTPLLEVKGCYRLVAKPGKLLHCSEAFVSAATKGPVTVDIPGPINEPFELVIKLSNFMLKQGGMGMVDDIKYSADGLCSDKNSAEATTIAGKKKQSAKSNEKNEKEHDSVEKKTLSETETEATVKPKTSGSTTACKALSCTFDDSCQYDLSAANAQQFKIQTGPTEMRSGIRYDIDGKTNIKGGYLLADGGKNSKKESFVATSAPFTIDKPTKVKFHRWQGSPRIVLKICVNDLTNCPWSYPKYSRDWVQEEITLDPATVKEDSKLLFVADGVSSLGNFLAIDNVKVDPSDCS